MELTFVRLQAELLTDDVCSLFGHFESPRVPFRVLSKMLPVFSYFHPTNYANNSSFPIERHHLLCLWTHTSFRPAYHSITVEIKKKSASNLKRFIIFLRFSQQSFNISF